MAVMKYPLTLTRVIIMPLIAFIVPFQIPFVGREDM
jgi:hypothetical protein